VPTLCCLTTVIEGRGVFNIAFGRWHKPRGLLITLLLPVTMAVCLLFVVLYILWDIGIVIVVVKGVIVIVAVGTFVFDIVIVIVVIVIAIVDFVIVVIIVIVIVIVAVVVVVVVVVVTCNNLTSNQASLFDFPIYFY
jgi:hypothetical protein